MTIQINAATRLKSASTTVQSASSSIWDAPFQDLMMQLQGKPRVDKDEAAEQLVTMLDKNTFKKHFKTDHAAAYEDALSYVKNLKRSIN